MNELKKFGIIPVDFSTLTSAFVHYKFPKDKVSSLEKSGKLIRLKKGMFVVSANIHDQALCFLAGANSIFFGDKLLTVKNMTVNEDQYLLDTIGMVPTRYQELTTLER